MFPSFDDRSAFERLVVTDDAFPYTDEKFDDKDVKGILFKLRAVLESDDMWVSVVRTADGSLVKSYDEMFHTWEEAIQHAKFRILLPNL